LSRLNSKPRNQEIPRRSLPVFLNLGNLRVFPEDPALPRISPMQPTLSETQCRLLRMIFERGSESASNALSRWLGREVRLMISEVEQVELEDATALLGPPEALVAACSMELSGPLSGHMLLVFTDRAGLALVDVLLGQPSGTSKAWGELEQSAVKETTNIVGCAYLNALLTHLPGAMLREGVGEELVPTSPVFHREFAGALLEFALMEQALDLDKVLLVQTAFAAAHQETQLNWTLLFVPDRESLRAMAAALAQLETR
jgi:chemotaxis protein CheC